MISEKIYSQIIDTVKSVLPENMEFVALHEPLFNGNEWNYVKDCIDTGWVSSVGKYVDEFERKIEEYTGIKHAIAVVNGTAALHIALKLVGVSENDEVLIPDLTFIATANSVIYNRAIPHFIDIEEKTLGLDPKKLEAYLMEIAIVKEDGTYNKKTGRRIKAIVPMHTFGHPVDIEKLVEISNRYKIELVEDAAESLGSFYKGKHTGNWGKISALSFNGNKIVTTGGGGAILTNDEKIAKLAKHITTTAKVQHQWEYFHNEVGYNYRLPNINAALGVAQMEQLPIYVEKKRALANKYINAFKEINGVDFFTEPDLATSNYWLNAILLKKEYSHLRDLLLEYFNSNGIMTRPAWSLMHKLPMFDEFPKMDISVAEDIEKRLINLPSSVILGGNNG